MHYKIDCYRMRKEFNITGICRPAEHYMADVSNKLASTFQLVQKKKYFIINRPRQYGKTTMLYILAKTLREQGDYVVFNISFEGIGDDIFKEEKLFAPGFLRLLQIEAKVHSPELLAMLKENEKEVHSLESLSDTITKIVEQTSKKVVLLIDEVDKSSNNQLFINFLAMLRNKYLAQEDIPTFHSVVLAGLHDIKTLKSKLLPEDEENYNAPWNIASDYNVNLNLQITEIILMLEDYCAESGVKMDTQKIAESLFYYTSGYPFLVSKLCKMLDEDFLKHDTWTAEDIMQAARYLVGEVNANFDSLVKNLENNQDLYNYVYSIIIDNDARPFNIHNPTANLAYLHGIIVKENGKTVVHNKIYQEVIANYMTDKMHKTEFSSSRELGAGYKYANGTLNMQAILLGFQIFMKKEYSKKDRDFLEKHGRLVFLAFLKPIINGEGFDFKEPQISDEKRLDVVITHLNNKYIAELKLWRGDIAHQKGLEQLCDYLDRQSLSEGYLVVFDHAEIKEWKSEEIEMNGKKIFIIWV